jgi:hypothetical protein
MRLLLHADDLEQQAQRLEREAGAPSLIAASD